MGDEWALFEANPRPQFVLDRETLEILAVNQAASELYGWSREELIEVGVRRLRPPEDLADLEFGASRARNYPKLSGRRRHWARDGRRFDVLVEAVHCDFRGHAAALLVMTELTPPNDGERRFRMLVEHSSDGIHLVDDRGRFVYLSPGAERIFGALSGELEGRLAAELIHADDLPTLVVPKPGQTVVNVGRGLRVDGTPRWLEWTTTNLNHDPGIRAFVTNFRDITDRRMAELTLMTADRLMSVGTLAAGVAHEINNPLAYVSANLELLERELRGQDAVSGLVRDAREGAQRVGAIVRDLLALSRPDDDTCGPVDIVAILTSSIKMASNELRHRARLVQTFAPDLPRVHASPSRLGQVFINMLVNAAHAIEAGNAEQEEVRVRVTASGDRTRVMVEIEDTGAGIAPQIVDRIFDPFFTTKPQGLGTGLGLAISHQIVQSLGGEITVTSELGRGTTFHIALQASELAVPAPITAERPAMRAARILMIDDEAAIGHAVEALLAPEHEVVPVTRGSAALAKLAAGDVFDVILCDLMMPEMTGMEVYEHLAPKDRERLVFLTGGAFTPQARAFLEATGRTRLDKPFSEEQLRLAIASVQR
jgi:PAS domain S-box-containing protein